MKKPNWHDGVHRCDLNLAVRYSPKAQLSLQQIVVHLTFGVGYVSELFGGNKARVIFADGPRTLVHGRGESGDDRRGERVLAGEVLELLSEVLGSDEKQELHELQQTLQDEGQGIPREEPNKEVNGEDSEEEPSRTNPFEPEESAAEAERRQAAEPDGKRAGAGDRTGLAGVGALHPGGVELPAINQEAAMENLSKQVERIRRHQKELDRIKVLLGDNGSPGAGGLRSTTPPLDEKAREMNIKVAEDHRRQILEAIQDMKLSRRSIDGIVGELTLLVERVARAEKYLIQCERRAGLHPSELHEIEARMKLTIKRIRAVGAGGATLLWARVGVLEVFGESREGVLHVSLETVDLPGELRQEEDQHDEKAESEDQNDRRSGRSRAVHVLAERLRSLRRALASIWRIWSRVTRSPGRFPRACGRRTHRFRSACAAPSLPAASAWPARGVSDRPGSC